MIRPQFSAVVDATQFFLRFYYHFHHFSSKHLIYIYLTVVEMVVEVVEIWQVFFTTDFADDTDFGCALFVHCTDLYGFLRLKPPINKRSQSV